MHAKQVNMQYDISGCPTACKNPHVVDQLTLRDAQTSHSVIARVTCYLPIDAARRADAS